MANLNAPGAALVVIGNPGDDLLDFELLVSEGLTAGEAQVVLGPHSAIARWEAHDRYEQFVRDQRQTNKGGI